MLHRFQVYNFLGIKEGIVVASNPFEALRIAKLSGLFAPMVDANPVKGK